MGCVAAERQAEIHVDLYVEDVGEKKQMSRWLVGIFLIFVDYDDIPGGMLVVCQCGI